MTRSVSEAFRPERCRRGPRHHYHPVPMVGGAVMFVMALAGNHWDVAPLVPLLGASMAIVAGLRHTPHAGGGDG